MFSGARKDELRQIAEEIGENPTEQMKIIELKELIVKNENYKKDPTFVNEYLNTIIANRKAEEAKNIEIEKIRLERVKTELELERIRAESNNKDSKAETSDKNLQESLDSLIKSIRTLTIKIPSKPEGWGFFFSTLERAFITKDVPDKFKAEILLNLLGDKALNVIVYIKEEELNDYEKVKSLVLKEFEPTPQICLENFRKAQRMNESHTQFASRLTTNFEYYLKLRKVSDFDTLKQLIVADKLFQTLEKDTAAHVSIRQGDSWFPPQILAKECDLYYTSRGKSIMETSNNFQKYKNNFYQKNNKGSSAKVFISNVKSAKCSLCESNQHAIFNCPIFKKQTVQERVETVKKKSLCFRCLSDRHAIKSCRSKYLCGVDGCQMTHNALLHFNREKPPVSHQVNYEKGGNNAPTTAAVMSQAEAVESGEYYVGNCVDNHKSVFLSTAICHIRDKWGNFHECRAMLDGGSMANFMSKSLADKLQLPRQKINIRVSCLNNASIGVRGQVSATIANKNRRFMRELDCLVIDKISGLIPSKRVNVNIPGSEYISFADNNFNVPGVIDLLLGAEIMYQLLLPGQICPPNSNLALQNTVFGHVVSGSVTENTDSVHCGVVVEDNLDQILRRFWELENVDNEPPKNKETEICDNHYIKTHMRDSEGKYVVTYPLKEEPTCLGQSREIALRRLNSLWRKLEKEPEYLSLYREFLQEYEDMGHMREVLDDKDPEVAYYIPHMGVYRPLKTTSRLRVVYNASTPTTNGKSLNSIQYNGGVIQADLFTIMVRFRQFLYAFTADIQKMYRMIKIHPSQQCLQRILWKEGMHEPVKTFELTTVSYGMVSSPYLAMRTLQQLSKDEGACFPLAAPVLLDSFYMDDVLCGAKTLMEAKELLSQLKNILGTCGMQLHKVCGNDPELTPGFDSSYDFSSPDEVKTLGVWWSSVKDCFKFTITVEKPDFITKRSVLSTIARVYDPLGILGPVVTLAKIFLQKLWLLAIDWDDKLPAKEHQEWEQFIDSLTLINNIEIERCIVIKNPIVIELHGFADSSESAYGAVLYAKSSNNSGDVSVKLIASKSRVCPLKRLTIPRLELNAAVLLAKLVTKVIAALKLDVSDIYLWSDAMIVLSWIQKEPHVLKTFVGNRVAKIQELTSISQWRHVSSGENPADLLSRGLEPEKLVKNELWFQGPSFLTQNYYPKTLINISDQRKDYECEMKNSENRDTEGCTSAFKITLEHFMQDILNISNSYTKIIHIFSYLYRFVNNCRRPKEKSVGPLTFLEIRKGEVTLLKLVQEQQFGAELKGLRKNGKVGNDSQVRNLNPFLDKDGLMRIGGRLGNSNLPFSQKFPILLPAKNKVTRMIVEHIHLKYLHLGPQSLLFHVRFKYWPLSGRAICRKVVHECVQCFRVKPVTCSQLMGELPKERVTQNYPFNCSGVDYCGPFLIRYRNQRRGIYHKIYVAIFVCFATKAVHIEMVTDLTSQAFIASLKRFIARRGKCSILFSDNGKNFVGSNTELKKLQKLASNPDEVLSGYLSNEGIEWKFLPPRGPNFGGLCEGGVKSFKYHLKRVAGISKLTYEEFLTLITQIEGILNSRPLIPLSADVEDLKALTPGHFLIGRPIDSLVEPSVVEINDNKLNLWERVTKMTQIMWKKWSTDYLNTLQQRNKWFWEKDNVQVGDMVVVKEDNMAVCNWPLGRIVNTFPGKDGKIRVVTVRTQKGLFKRPLSKLCLLPTKTG